MDKMIVTTFETDVQAYEGLEALRDLHREGDITLYATAIITKRLNGDVVMEQEADKGPIGTTIGTLTGALLGLAGGAAGAAIGTAAATGLGASVGALTGMTYDATEYAINAQFVDEVSVLLLPGTTALLAEVGEDGELAANVALGRVGGLVFRVSRDDVVDDQLLNESIAYNAKMDELKANAKASRDDTKQSIKDTRDSITAKLESVVDRANKKIDEINEETDAKIKKLEAQMKDAKESQKASIELRIAELKASQKLRTQKLKKARALAKEALTE